VARRTPHSVRVCNGADVRGWPLPIAFGWLYGVAHPFCGLCRWGGAASGKPRSVVPSLVTEVTLMKYHARIMPYAPDLAGPGPVKNVGFLWFRHAYTMGKVPPLVFERLVALVEKPLAWYGGYHICNVGSCALTEGLRGQPIFRYRGRLLGLGSSDILVPGEDAVYNAPNLILHYIRHHRYQPPACFCAAVLDCPEPDSAEYRERVVQTAPQLASYFGSPDILKRNHRAPQ